jgi:hypothetical protein
MVNIVVELLTLSFSFVPLRLMTSTLACTPAHFWQSVLMPDQRDRSERMVHSFPLVLWVSKYSFILSQYVSLV